MGIRRQLLLVRVVRPLHRLPREALVASSLEVFRLDQAWSNHIPCGRTHGVMEQDELLRSFPTQTLLCSVILHPGTGTANS